VVVRDRQLLARDGILLVVVSIDKQTGQIAAGPDIVTRGFVYAAEAGELLDRTKERVREALSVYQNSNTPPPDWNFLNKKVKDTVSQYLYDQTKRRPMVLPVVMEI
jgi:ribonuclease J